MPKGRKMIRCRSVKRKLTPGVALFCTVRGGGREERGGWGREQNNHGRRKTEQTRTFVILFHTHTHILSCTFLYCYEGRKGERRKRRNSEERKMISFKNQGKVQKDKREEEN